MTEAVAKFTDHIFERFGLVRIYAEPYATNAASCRVLEKAGFVLEGRMQKECDQGRPDAGPVPIRKNSRKTGSVK